MTREPDWTPEEDAFLKENYGKKTHQEMATHLQRTKRAVAARLLKLQICTQKTWFWTAEDDQFLRDNVNNMPYEVIAKALNRTLRATVLRLHALRITKKRGHQWTQEEDVYLHENFGKKTFREMGQYLGLSTDMVWRRTVKLELKETLAGGSKGEVAARKVVYVRPKKHSDTPAYDTLPAAVNPFASLLQSGGQE